MKLIQADIDASFHHIVNKRRAAGEKEFDKSGTISLGISGKLFSTIEISATDASLRTNAHSTNQLAIVSTEENRRREGSNYT